MPIMNHEDKLALTSSFKNLQDEIAHLYALVEVYDPLKTKWEMAGRIDLFPDIDMEEELKKYGDGHYRLTLFDQECKKVKVVNGAPMKPFVVRLGNHQQIPNEKTKEIIEKDVIKEDNSADKTILDIKKNLVQSIEVLNLKNLQDSLLSPQKPEESIKLDGISSKIFELEKKINNEKESKDKADILDILLRTQEKNNEQIEKITMQYKEKEEKMAEKIEKTIQEKDKIAENNIHTLLQATMSKKDEILPVLLASLINQKTDYGSNPIQQMMTSMLLLEKEKEERRERILSEERKERDKQAQLERERQERKEKEEKEARERRDMEMRLLQERKEKEEKEARERRDMEMRLLQERKEKEEKEARERRDMEMRLLQEKEEKKIQEERERLERIEREKLQFQKEMRETMLQMQEKTQQQQIEFQKQQQLLLQKQQDQSQEFFKLFLSMNTQKEQQRDPLESIKIATEILKSNTQKQPDYIEMIQKISSVLPLENIITKLTKPSDMDKNFTEVMSNVTNTVTSLTTKMAEKMIESSIETSSKDREDYREKYRNRRGRNRYDDDDDLNFDFEKKDKEEVSPLRKKMESVIYLVNSLTPSIIQLFGSIASAKQAGNLAKERNIAELQSKFQDKQQLSYVPTDEKQKIPKQNGIMPRKSIVKQPLETVSPIIQNNGNDNYIIDQKINESLLQPIQQRKTNGLDGIGFGQIQEVVQDISEIIEKENTNTAIEIIQKKYTGLLDVIKTNPMILEQINASKDSISPKFKIFIEKIKQI